MGSGKKGGKYSGSTSKTTTTKEDQIRANEEKIKALRKEYYTEMSSTETNHSVGWRDSMKQEIEKLQEENSKLKYGEVGGQLKSVELNIEDYLKEKGEKAARDRRSILYAEEIGEILAKLPAGTKIYTGETTALAVINGKDEIGVPTFFVKISDGQYSRYKRFGTDDYADVYGASIGEDIIRGYRLKKLKLRFE